MGQEEEARTPLVLGWDLAGLLHGGQLGPGQLCNFKAVSASGLGSLAPLTSSDLGAVGEGGQPLLQVLLPPLPLGERPSRLEHSAWILLGPVSSSQLPAAQSCTPHSFGPSRGENTGLGDSLTGPNSRSPAPCHEEAPAARRATRPKSPPPATANTPHSSEEGRLQPQPPSSPS